MKPPIRMSHPKPVVPRLLVALFSCCIGYIILYAALVSVLHTRSLYTTDPSLVDKNAAVLAYVTGPIGAPNHLEFLSPAEWAHMSDVKRLFDIAFIIYLCCVGVAIGVVTVFIANKWWPRLDELLGRSLRAVGWTLLALCLVIGGAALLNFDKFWILFHAILFPQGNWAFASDSMLITLYPGVFFERFVLRWSIMVLSFGVVGVLLSYFLERMRRAEHEFSAPRTAPERKAEKGAHRKKR